MSDYIFMVIIGYPMKIIVRFKEVKFVVDLVEIAHWDSISE